jgi:hypothetical protein
VAAVDQGWSNADGSQQSITLVRFATPAGARSEFDQVRAWFQTWSTPLTPLAVPAIGAVGLSDPRLDSQGDANVELVAAVGDTMVFVNEYTAARPHVAAAKALLRRQYNRLKNTS